MVTTMRADDLPTLQQWMQAPASTITYDYNRPALSRDIFSTEAPEITPPPQKLYDLGSYWTPFRALFNRSRNVLTQG